MPAVSAPRPLRSDDERSTFDCGRDALNGWFRRHAWANHANDMSRVNVITESASGRIVGYATLSAASIARGFLPKNQQRNRLEHVPATLLGQLAVDRAHQGCGHAASLLYFALGTALRASTSVASVGVITPPLDDEVRRRFYAQWGFVDLSSDPRRAMILRVADLALTFSN